MLAVEEARKVFQPGTPNEHVALDELSIDLKEGEVVTLIGSNGAGKSTLLNAITGGFLLDGGRVVLGGEDITWLPPHKRAFMIGYLFQDPLKGTAPGMTIEENLALACSRHSTPQGGGIFGFLKRWPLRPGINKKDSALFRDLLARFGMGLEDRMETRAGLLSGGQRQALALLMATAANPRLLLLDEHTAALDPAAAEKIMAITRETVKERNLTTMMVTHNIQQALRFGTRTVMLEDGRIILDISGEERNKMTIPRLMELYSQHSRKGQPLDNDRMLLE
ncbi:MAG: ATP-binding cassette domain-containing protein [Synergistaceae bacterium]|jgi:putative ABC transport system ATP-binding protein|nr:ATP-binding cassette domain-containing protein [Synergistaceae bacterium]